MVKDIACKTEILNIQGFEVTLKKYKGFKEHLNGHFPDYYCSYVRLPFSRIFSVEFLGYPTYREKDLIGFDTAHPRNLNQSMQRKKKDAIQQVTYAIENYLKVVKK